MIGGTSLTPFAYTQTSHTVTDATSFQNVLFEITTNPGTSHVVTIANSFTITDPVSPIAVDAGQTVQIIGVGNTITANDGAGNGVRPFFVHKGVVMISDLTIDQGTAKGGDGSGGGLGAGGAIFVNEGGDVMLTDVKFTQSSATGGAGGGVTRGGGGLGGDGGTRTENGGGAGGVGSGDARGRGIFLQNAGITFQVDGTATTTIDDEIDNAIVDENGNAVAPTVDTLTKTGSGTLVLAADNPYTGVTSVDGGTLIVNGTTDQSTFEINAGGTLGGDGTVGATQVASGATIAPGNSIGTLTVAGDYTQQSGSRYEVEIEPGGTSDLIVVNGTATIEGGDVDVKSGGQTGFTTGQRFTILTATGGVNGTYDSIVDDLAFLDASLLYLPNDVLIELLRNQTDFQDVALTPNQIAVAENLSPFGNVTEGDLATILDAIIGLSTAGARDAFDDLSGEFHGSVRSAQRQFADSYLRQGRHHLRKHVGFLWDADDTDGIVRGQSDGFAVTQFAGYSTPAHGKSSPVPAEQWVGWIDGYGVEGNVEGDGNAASSQYRTGGTVFGFDYRYTQDLAVSVFGGYGTSQVYSGRNSDNADIDNARVSIGGVYSPEPFYLLGSVGYGFSEFETDREISFGPINRRAEADYDGHEILSYLEAGIVGDFGSWLLTPHLTAQHHYIQTEAFRETGAGAASLSIAEEEINSLRLGAGLTLSKAIERERGGAVIPELSAHYYHEVLDNQFPVVGAFGQTGGSTFTSLGNALGRDFGEIGLGFTFIGTENVDFGFRYDLQFSEEHVAHQGSGGLRIRW